MSLGFVDYMILEFKNNGTFKSAKNIYHWDDDMQVTEETKNSQITKGLKSYF